jgi:hypothetical protein
MRLSMCPMKEFDARLYCRECGSRLGWFAVQNEDHTAFSVAGHVCTSAPPLFPPRSALLWAPRLKRYARRLNEIRGVQA